MTKRHEEDEEKIVRDGGKVRVSVMLMDSMDEVQKAIASGDGDAARKAAYERRDRALNDAWRNPGQDAPSIVPAATVADSYARRDERLRNAWKGGGT